MLPGLRDLLWIRPPNLRGILWVRHGALYFVARIVLLGTFVACCAIYVVSIWDPEVWGSSGVQLWPYLMLPLVFGAILNLIGAFLLARSGRAQLAMQRYEFQANAIVMPFVVMLIFASVLAFRAGLGGDVYPNFNGHVYQLVYSGFTHVISRSTYHRDLEAEYLVCSSFVSIICFVAFGGGWMTPIDNEVAT